jgi:hypothetical protein
VVRRIWLKKHLGGSSDCYRRHDPLHGAWRRTPVSSGGLLQPRRRTQRILHALSKGCVNERRTVDIATYEQVSHRQNLIQLIPLVNNKTAGRNCTSGRNCPLAPILQL